MKDSWLYAKETASTSSKKWNPLVEKHDQFVKSGKNFTTRWQHCLLLTSFCVFQSSLILKTNCTEVCSPQPTHCKNWGNKASGIRWFGEVVTSGRLICWTSYFKSVKGYSFCKDTDKTSFSLRNVLSIAFLSLRMIKRARGEAFKVGILGFSFTTRFLWNQGSNIILSQLRIWPQSVLSYKGSRLG